MWHFTALDWLPVPGHVLHPGEPRFGPSCAAERAQHGPTVGRMCFAGHLNCTHIYWYIYQYTYVGIPASAVHVISLCRPAFALFTVLAVV